MKNALAANVARIHRIATAAALALLVGALAVVYCFSPDFSETVGEFLSSLVDEKGIQVEREVSYVLPADSHRSGDLYSPQTRAGTRPAIVIVHGGSWSQGSKRDFAEVGIARYFVRNGYLAFSIDYRLLPGAFCGPIPRGSRSIPSASLCLVRRPGRRLPWWRPIRLVGMISRLLPERVVRLGPWQVFPALPILYRSPPIHMCRSTCAARERPRRSSLYAKPLR